MKISKMTKSMLILLALCLLSDICASYTGTVDNKSEQGFLVFEKASGGGGSRGGGSFGGSRGGGSFGGSTGSSRGGSSSGSRGSSSGSRGSSSGSRGKSGGSSSKGRSSGRGNSNSPLQNTPAGAYNNPQDHAHGSGCVHKAVIHSLASSILGLSVLLCLA